MPNPSYDLCVHLVVPFSVFPVYMTFYHESFIWYIFFLKLQLPESCDYNRISSSIIYFFKEGLVTIIMEISFKIGHENALKVEKKWGGGEIEFINQKL